MSRFEARVIQDNYRFDLNLVRLAVIDLDSHHVLMENGTWTTVTDGQSLEGAGIVLPAAAVEAIAVAIEQFQGHASHADTEARVLRESLEVERARVDRMLAR